jgi:hypothetical protein
MSTVGREMRGDEPEDKIEPALRNPGVQEKAFKVFSGSGYFVERWQRRFAMSPYMYG